jgi:CheY-like chemotaxis protein
LTKLLCYPADWKGKFPLSHLPHKPRVLLADDYRGIHTAVSRLLASSCQIVENVFSGTALLVTVNNVQPEVVLLDRTLPDMDGLDACRRILETNPHVKVIILTAGGESNLRDKALAAGASGFVLKMKLATDLLPAIERALYETSEIGRNKIA